ncbi:MULTISPECIES: MSMEG_0565 family glycosyltransferase [unclassified Saccharopolyspora]|uniref:MSMEG_0565 family glycosyltransferase n=1 Tax=unclassified Saccharopolyspora TaxID=2646250 RepID=UPI001CD5ED4E|nr:MULTISPECIES: MSMEG_0565 family glycosyltransferase [unclassified Saccharopolyspora]MCA1186239.1 MSMEG_0565 family glycosyltransferase [Saccharopolyspora sp. 6T]MCA1194625.1 MSMEG_0565 family glycosyltransferase [Saccharopolyspora sp. 6V]MCA1229224.1 MSMEG_0565 family glycosyltransferase [Saccharopolyspora sp. 6M]MCA1278441.1 MSMEG_0565 family glycosyltransferase [Saccharopolyspora sp. 7B]
MKIALVSYSTKPRGGVVHTLALAEALAAAGEDVAVWTLGRGGDTGFFRPVHDAVEVRIVPFPDRPGGETVGERVLRSIEALGAAFTPDEYDVVHAQDCISANAVGDCVRTVHHIDHFSTPELAACHERAIITPHSHVCVSHSVADELSAGWGVEAEVIPNGVAYERFADTTEQDRRYWTDRLGRYVLTVGGIEPRKGSLDLLEAYVLLRERQPDVALVIAGGETLFDYRDYRRRWEDRAVELGVEPVVLGPVAEHELPGLVAAASAFAFPSTKEGFGLAAMEALAAGTPLVVRELPVLKEVFGAAARFADGAESFAAELAAALADDDLDRREAGRTLAAAHTWQTAAERHIAFYRSLRRGRS